MLRGLIAFLLSDAVGLMAGWFSYNYLSSHVPGFGVLAIAVVLSIGIAVNAARIAVSMLRNGSSLDAILFPTSLWGFALGWLHAVTSLYRLSCSSQAS